MTIEYAELKDTAGGEHCLRALNTIQLAPGTGCLMSPSYDWRLMLPMRRIILPDLHWRLVFDPQTR